MSKEKISAVKLKAIIRMNDLGFTVTRISKLLGVSRVTVYDHIDPSKYKARLRRTTASYREKQTTARKRPKRCEVCRCEAANKRFYFHILDKKQSSAGLWLCSSCNTFCDICDGLGVSGVLKRATTYFNLVDQLLPESSKSRNE